MIVTELEKLGVYYESWIYWSWKYWRKQPRSLLRNAVDLKVYYLNDDLVSELNVRVLREPRAQHRL